MLGSSSIYNTPTNCEPICVANLIRCASPPERDFDERLSCKYCRPTSNKNCNLTRISFIISDPIFFSFALKLLERSAIHSCKSFRSIDTKLEIVLLFNLK